MVRKSCSGKIGGYMINPLLSSFPDLFKMSQQQDITLADVK